MTNEPNFLCRDIHGHVHIVPKNSLIKRKAGYALIKTGQGILLVRKQGSSEKWDFPGGGIDKSEGLTEALRREVIEETGWEIVSKPSKICEFIEYFYDVDTQQGWESTRLFFKVGAAQPIPNNKPTDMEARFFQPPFDIADIMPVAKEIISRL